MTNTKQVSGWLLLLLTLLVLASCDGSKKERDKAVTQAEQAMAELAEVRAILKRTQSEKDELAEVLDRASTKWEQGRSQLAAVIKARDKLQQQTNQLTAERNAAIAKAKDSQAMVQDLRNQLKEKEAQVREFEEWVKELQATIEELQAQVEQTEQQQGEVTVEEPNEESTDETGDGDNV